MVSMWPFGEGHDNMISLVHKNMVILIIFMVYKYNVGDFVDVKNIQLWRNVFITEKEAPRS